MFFFFIRNFQAILAIQGMSCMVVYIAKDRTMGTEVNHWMGEGTTILGTLRWKERSLPVRGKDWYV